MRIAAEIFNRSVGKNRAISVQDMMTASSTAASTMTAAGDAMDHAAAALRAATGDEAGADTPVEAKSGGRKAKAKTGVNSASLEKSGEEVTWPPRVFCLAVGGKSPIAGTLENRPRILVDNMEL